MRCLLLLLLALPCGLAQAQPMQDPWLPPAARQAALAPATSGHALRAQVQAKLAAQFRQADLRGRGALTLAEARAAGFGWLVQHFERIDSGGRGELSLQDLQQYLLRQQSL
ncbi:EF-hand domain-containing protein [Paucibacter soli]|uniref:EF-hand domain-containing protein n=1 Tax=Paucibacter soli TaxID=3133433 RepID=UPI0030B1DE7D